MRRCYAVPECDAVSECDTSFKGYCVVLHVCEVGIQNSGTEWWETRFSPLQRLVFL